MNGCSVSIIVPIYNCEKVISRCIASIYAQSFQDYEIILVNDGSKDNSLSVCRSFEEKDKRITVIDKPNGGAGSARNAGLEVAKGKYIYFFDADDEICPDLLSITYSKAVENNYDLVVFAVKTITPGITKGNRNEERTTTKTYLECRDINEFRNHFIDLYYGGTLFGGPINKLFKRSVITQNHITFPDLKRGQDEIFNFRFYRYTNTAIIIPDVLYTYYIFDEKAKNRKYRLSYFEQTTVMYFQTVRDLLNAFDLRDDHSLEKFQNSFVYSMQATPELAWNPEEKLNSQQKIAFIDSVLHHPFIREIVPAIRFVPDSCKEYWELFRKDDATALYRYITRQKRIRKAKDMIKAFIGRK